MKAVVTEACGCELFRGRHFARSTKRTRLAEADVVEQNNDHVRRSPWGFDLKTWRRFGVPRVKLRNGWRLRLGNRQNGAIEATRISCTKSSTLLSDRARERHRREQQ